MHNKRALFGKLADIILILLAIFILAIITQNLLGKGGAEASDYISQTKDFDGDGLSDIIDKCDCLSGDDRNDGCPLNEPKTGEAAITREKNCQNTKADTQPKPK